MRYHSTLGIFWGHGGGVAPRAIGKSSFFFFVFVDFSFEKVKIEKRREGWNGREGKRGVDVGAVI